MNTEQSARPDANAWATLTVSMKGGRIEAEALARASDHLEDLAALLAMEAGVTGVQTRDPTNAPLERPQLVVYTDPVHLEQLWRRTETLGESLGLDIDLRQEIRDDEDWRDAWKAHYRPLVFGQGTLLLRPSWIERRDGDPQRELVLDPGRAFGTGLHESTALCLERLCRLHLEAFCATRVLDLGCGSGILVLGALRLWPEAIEHACAIDVDPDAVDTTRENAELNRLSDRVEASVGTLDTVSEGEPFDLLIANIRPDVLVPIAAGLRAVARPGAQLVLGGILEEEAQRVRSAYLAAGWQPVADDGSRARGEWVGLDFTAPR